MLLPSPCMWQSGCVNCYPVLMLGGLGVLAAVLFHVLELLATGQN